MNPQSWEEKLEVLRAIDHGVNVHMRHPGDWYCSIPGQKTDGSIATSWTGNGTTPMAAINDAWEQWINLPEKYHVYLRGRRFRWSPLIGLKDIEL